MATVGQINKQDVCTCPICLETLKSPKSLPCLHTFCETCIGEFILSTEQRTEQRLSNYPCPVCRTVVTPTNPKDEASQWAASLPNNFTISSLMDNSKSVKQECHLCQRRDKISEATQWCRDCFEALCEECLQLHGLMKLFADHKIVLIEEIDTFVSVEEPDLSMISDLCPVHTSKVLEAFCFDHQELCCVFCLTLQHRKCEKVQVIEDINHSKKDMIKALMSDVVDFKVKVETIIKEKRVEKEKLDAAFIGIEEQAKKFIESLKDKLDNLLNVFIKELDITREDSEHAFDNKLKSLQKLSNYFDKLQCTTKTVQDHGTLNHMFIHYETSKTKLKSALTEASMILNVSSIRTARLDKSKKLDQVQRANDLGVLKLTRTIPKEMNTYIKQLFPTNSSLHSKTLPYSSFDSIILKHIKTIDINGFDVYGGVFVSDNVIVFGGKADESAGKVKAIGIWNEKIIDECSLSTIVKRLTFDVESKSLFISCSDSKILRLKFASLFNSKITIKDGSHFNGGLCILDRALYAIVETTISKLSLENLQKPLEVCFATNTCCLNINGLEIDSKNHRFLYTSAKYEVVCISLDGKDIFKYKDDYMKETRSLSVHPNGIICVGDLSGQIHLISEDGQKRRTILNSCHKLQAVHDLCFDESSSRMAVFGPGYIELYDVCTGSG
ncbi:uncharacterized protein LOC134695942 [Mytilus trossulus]|uniref:uncharacterized protein LOC134695942 n=1 Tax=Mytilus trossulus TaxID=6551 RepID=UPI003005DDCD